MNWQALPLPFCSLPESPRYAHGGWMWLDIDSRKLYRLKKANILKATEANLQILDLQDELGCILPTEKPDTLVGLGRQGGWLIEQNIMTQRLAAPFDQNRQRFNDGRADAKGRIWISTLVDARTPPEAALYRVQAGRAEARVPDLIVGNGLAFTPAGDAAFLSDTRLRCIWRYTYDSSTGELGQPVLVKQYTDGTARPDGACFSTDGSYWVAILEGYRLERFSAEGEFIEQIDLPLAKPTMPCFGGPKRNQLLVCGAKPSDQLPNRPGFENDSFVACETSFEGYPEAFADPANLG